MLKFSFQLCHWISVPKPARIVNFAKLMSGIRLTANSANILLASWFMKPSVLSTRNHLKILKAIVSLNSVLVMDMVSRRNFSKYLCPEKTVLQPNNFINLDSDIPVFSNTTSPIASLTEMWRPMILKSMEVSNAISCSFVKPLSWILASLHKARFHVFLLKPIIGDL